MSPRLARLVCRIRNHHNLAGLEVPLGMTVLVCNTCREPLMARRGSKARPIQSQR